jgi:predicted ATP-dependent endonuclease of OLD family
VETCFRERVDQDGEETFVTIEGKYEPDDDGIYTWTTQVLPPNGRSNNPISMSRRMVRAVPLYFLDAVRDATRDTRATGRGLLAQLLSEVDFTDVQDDVKSHLCNANTALSKGQDISKLAQGLTKQLTPYMPGGQSEILVAIAGEDTSRLVQGFRLNIRKTVGSMQSDISRHGTGLQNLTLIAMFRHRVASENQGTPILAVEEPEAHLHPHAQRSLFKDLAEINAPIFLTTHSPSIVKYADPLSLVLLRSIASDETQAYQLDTYKLGVSERKELSYFMREGKAEVFFSRAIIIVEGECELITLSAFAELLGCDLDRDGISLISADGNGNYHLIIKACQPDQFKIPVIVTYDIDALETDNKLVESAYLSGLIDMETRNSCKDNSNPQQAKLQRKNALDSINWFGATECFEDEVCNHGYCDTILQTLEALDSDNKSQLRALETHLSNTQLEKDAKGISSFIKKRKNLKIPVARAISDSAKEVNRVPDCYANAIRKAILESVGNFPIDSYFEQRACSAGFYNVIQETLTSNHANKLTCFLEERGLEDNRVSLIRFIAESEASLQIQSEVRLAVANAIERCGCKEYAELIRREVQKVSDSE